MTVLLAALLCGAAAPSLAQSVASEQPPGADDDRLRRNENGHATQSVPVTAGQLSRLSFYGMLRLDMIIDDSRPNALQTPLFIQSETDGPMTQERSFTLHPRLSRFGLDLAGPEVTLFGRPTLTGKLEVDFQNGGRESRAIPRFRHVYLKLAWKDVELLAGQTWDVISPIFPVVNADTLMWNAGNLGDRRPQVRLTFRPRTSAKAAAQVFVTVGAGLTGAVDGQDQDADGMLDGEASGVPNLQARVALETRPNGRSRRFAFGLWGHVGRMAVANPASGSTRRTQTSNSIGADYELTLTSRITARGELWTGESLGDVRGGVGQSFHPLTVDPISSRGGWSELGVQVARAYVMTGGYSVDNPEAGALRSDNSSWYLVNQYRSGRSFVLGLDYIYWRTRYRHAAAGDDHRFNTYLVFAF